METRTNIGKGVSIVRCWETPLEFFQNIGKGIKTRENFEKMYLKRPLTRKEKKRRDQIVAKIHQDINIYFNSKEK